METRGLIRENTEKKRRSACTVSNSRIVVKLPEESIHEEGKREEIEELEI